MDSVLRSANSMQNADLEAKDPELLLALENGDSSQNHPQLGDGPPGFGNGTLKDIGGMESAMGVQVAEQALAEPMDLGPAESQAKLDGRQFLYHWGFALGLM